MSRRFATVTLERGAVGVRVPTWRTVFQFAEEAQRPRTLRIETRAIVDGMSDDMRRAAAALAGGAGIWWGDEGEDLWDGGAAMRLTYGTQPGIQRTVYADLRSGEYAIPPCSAFELSAAYWAPIENQLGPLELAAELADGDCGDCTPLQLSATRKDEPYNEARSIASLRYCPVPPGAYAWEVYSDRPQVHARCGLVEVIRDRVTGAWQPPTMPHPIAGQDAHQVRIWSDVQGEAGMWSPLVVFFVR